MVNVFIQDIEQIKAFIKMHKRKEDYFNHVMDKLKRK